MLAHYDGDFSIRAYEFLRQGHKGTELKEAGILPDLRKRGSIRSVVDGRYTLTRYFSIKQHNRSTTLEQLRGLNGIELYDLDADPDEQRNLAAGDKPDNELVMAMNDRLNRLIDEEVGHDPGDIYPCAAQPLGVSGSIDPGRARQRQLRQTRHGDGSP